MQGGESYVTVDNFSIKTEQLIISVSKQKKIIISVSKIEKLKVFTFAAESLCNEANKNHQPQKMSASWCRAVPS